MNEITTLKILTNVTLLSKKSTGLVAQSVERCADNAKV